MNEHDRSVVIGEGWAVVDKHGHIVAVGRERKETIKAAVFVYRAIFEEGTSDKEVAQWMKENHGCFTTPVNLMAHWKVVHRRLNAVPTVGPDEKHLFRTLLPGGAGGKQDPKAQRPDAE